ncbi:MAG TPA: GNAT family N-acetyltransferase [Candidatus Nanopelagicaceae bacterium]
MLESTDDLKTAGQWAAELLAEKNLAKFYISKENFVRAYKQNGAYSFVVTGEPFYGQLYGEGAYFDERCTNVATAGFKPDSVGALKQGVSFQFWEAMTTDSGARIELLTNVDEINLIINEHAPDSSVRPGDPEEIFWGGIRNEAGELASLAALVKWQSGFHVLSSVVTRAQDRGKGYATKLCEGIAAHAHSLGIKEVGLGVRAENVTAQRAYEKAGFKKLADFTHYFQE